MNPTRTYPHVAWLVIVVAVGFVIWRQQLADAQTRKAGEDVGLLLQGRLLVGMNEMGLHDAARKELQALEAGPYRQRLLVAILVETVEGHEATLAYLARLEALRARQDYQPSDAEVALREAIEQLDAPTDETRAALAGRGWFRDLALGENDAKGSARGSFLKLAGVMLAGIALALTGFALLLVFVLIWWQGYWRWSFEPRPGGDLYAETFAVWFVLFLALGYLARFVPGLNTLAGNGVVALLTVCLALGWPVLRGRDWATVRADLGLTSGRGVGRELLAGLATYAACVPLLIVAVFIVAGLTNLYTQWQQAGGPPNPFAPSNRPSHPVAEMVLGDIWMLLGIYFTAAIVAPLAEEIAFRGFLQTHLRGYAGRLPSAVAVGLVFALIHPQGILGVPALLALAIPFSLAREWRGSLLAPMTAHALNNAAVTTLLVLATR